MDGERNRTGWATPEVRKVCGVAVVDGREYPCVRELGHEGFCEYRDIEIWAKRPELRVATIAKLELRPGDAVVVQMPEHYMERERAEAQEVMRATLEAALGYAPVVLVIPAGTKIGNLRFLEWDE